MAEMRITEWEIEDCGVDAPDYFQGRGVALTSWEDCAVGCGENPRAAADDAAEMLAQTGYAIPAAMEAEIKALSDESEIPEGSEDLYHYCAIYVK